MSDTTEPSLVAELEALAGKYRGPARIAYLDAVDIAERHQERWQAERKVLTARAEAAERELGNLLAVIFGDGGHRQAEIGDDAEAVRQAHERLAADRARLADLWETFRRARTILIAMEHRADFVEAGGLGEVEKQIVAIEKAVGNDGS